MDTYSGAVHLLDDTAYAVVSQLDGVYSQGCPDFLIKKLSNEYKKSEIEEAYAELYALYENGLLFSEDTYAGFAEMLGPAPVKSMCLNVAHDCNLKCRYCFASHGGFGGEKKLMPFETGKNAIDFLIKNSGGRKNLEVDFFGGEPLMNFDTVKKIVGYARGTEKEHNKNFRFTVTTNGILLDDEKIEYINREMCNVVLSLDGREEVNDFFRPTENGKGSYGLVVGKFKKLVGGRGGKPYYIRGTFTKYNLDF
ncbi:MAG: 4Fe-4S cluster-binding domain-containing protein, partial [Oscillospiraceae bacterium]|nr:4Fe-4S cluster-binding domain-containing protein [Oscillospiraceae bacterium]